MGRGGEGEEEERQWHLLNVSFARAVDFSFICVGGLFLSALRTGSYTLTTMRGFTTIYDDYYRHLSTFSKRHLEREREGKGNNRN